LEKLEQELALLKMEQEEVEEEMGSVRARVRQAESDLTVKGQALSALQATIEQAQEEIARAGQIREETSVALATAKAELSSFDQIVASRISSLKILEQTLEGAEAQVASDQEELHSLEESEAQWEAACRQMEADSVQLAKEEEHAQSEVERLQGLKSQAQEAAQTQERQWMVISRQLEQIQSKLHGEEMQQAQLSFQREQIGDRLRQVYQVNLEESGEIPQPISGEEELSELRGKAQELSEKLQRMGPVSLGSIEEERELQSRYEYLVTQQGDLLKAKEDLHEVITKINRTTRAMFRETFQAIQQEFQVTFKRLFGGGEARLVLMDEEDLLESGVEIIARPPGKPIQAISLLSGGEKALTTIALLFAIFRVKPSPFCLLDEIDAPLDEANIGRFTEALKDFLKESQFIIITHNKKTISMADVMYGVTMVESGVSKIVSVKFKQNGNGNGVLTPLQVPDNSPNR